LIRRKRLCTGLIVCMLLIAGYAWAQQTGGTNVYTITFADPVAHRLHVRFDRTFGDGANAIVQMPVWNALYQVRDFSQYIDSITAEDAQNRPVAVLELDKSSWSVPNAVHVDYDIIADNPGPYGAQFNGDHAFLNLAEVLMYSPQGRGNATVVIFKNVPAAWHIATVLQPHDAVPTQFEAANYDALVDAPVEAGKFREISFDDGGTRYRIAIDAGPDRYNANWIESSVRKVVRAEVAWMNDQPCREYLFIYHFPSLSGGGGMEHACSTAIDVPARSFATDPTSFEGVTAHEFFHLWNVKRIRPQSLEPVDYTKEQYTRALWFSEGVTSTVEDYILLRTGMIDGAEYLRRLGSEITTLQGRRAHLTQTAEESSLDAWLEKYAFYRRPERSISYYNKGEILGVMLDLAIRDATNGSRSLQDVFHWMNVNYAQRGRFFADSEGVRKAVEAVSGKDFSQFFQEYVSGLTEIPYDRFLGTAGLRIAQQQEQVADPGFTISRNFDGMPVVVAVHAGSAAAAAGLKAGDAIISVNGRTNLGLANEVEEMSAGDVLRLRVRLAGTRDERDLQFALGSRTETEYVIRDVDHPSAAQLKRRAEWLGAALQSANGSARP
jgi:predicted metalloprotease with PDZ domain